MKDLKIFTDNIEQEALNQINLLFFYWHIDNGCGMIYTRRMYVK